MTVEVEPVVAEDMEPVAKAVQSVVQNLPEDPQQRAQERLTRLRGSYAQTLAIAQEMYRDEDWKYLTRDDGSEYTSMAEVFSDVMTVSASMARRYVQGINQFYLPLMDAAPEGTNIAITSGDVAYLGAPGLEDAVDRAKAGLEGVEDPEQSETIIGQAVQDAKAAKKAQSPPEGDGWGDFTDDTAGHDGGGRAEARGFSGDDLDGLPSGDGDGDFSDGDGFTDDGGGAGWGGSPDVDLADPTQKVLEGAVDYADSEDLEALPEGLRDVCAAITTLAKMTPEDAADRVTYDTRGVLVHLDAARSALTRLEVLTTTKPWFVDRMGS